MGGNSHISFPSFPAYEPATTQSAVLALSGSQVLGLKPVVSMDGTSNLILGFFFSEGAPPGVGSPFFSTIIIFQKKLFPLGF